MSAPCDPVDPQIQALLATVGMAVPNGIEGRIVGHDPVLPSPYPLAEAAAAVLGAVGVASAVLWHERTGHGQAVEVDVRRAAAGIFAPRLQRLDGAPVESIPWQPMFGQYLCADKRWIQLCAPFPHLISGTLGVLGCGHSEAEVETAVGKWRSDDLEDALAAAGQCGVVLRTRGEWARHHQGRLLSELGPVLIEKVLDGPAVPLGPAAAPLAGLRVLDLTRIVAGPVHGRHLADMGAEVLLINSPKLINVKDSLIETGHGKRSAHLDLDCPDDVHRLKQLVESCDVFVDGYRSGALERKGFGVPALVAIRPGIIAVSINCFGHLGGWRARRGFEPIAQAAAGIASASGSGERPGLLPGTVCDYLTGGLAALGTIAALLRRATEGGSYRVCASLTRTAMWLADMEMSCDPAAASGFGDLSSWMVTEGTAFGQLAHLVSPITMSATAPGWRRTAVPTGTDPPAWNASDRSA
jgi:crotonobetainyl-CoA:carnitine CoA-transferase CaiB-like acyl-CoA transferase